MKTHLVSFSTPIYRQSQKALELSALKFGIDKVHTFTEKDIKKTKFYKENTFIFKKKRGFGYWLWKPYIILETLKQLPEGDILMYCDSDAIILESLKPLFDICQEKNIALFQVHARLNRTWTKKDTFILMGVDYPQYYEAEQVCGSPQLYKVNAKSIQFVEKWLKYCTDPRIITDQPNELGFNNLSDFIEHRHDQSILSLLSLKYKIEIHRDPSQWGNDYIESYSRNSNYSQLINLYNVDKRNIIQKIRGLLSTLLKPYIGFLWKKNQSLSA